MTAYVLRRLSYLVPLWIGLSVFSFTLGALAPGNPARAILAQRSLTPPTDEAVANFAERLGLNDPAVVQYGRWLKKAFQGDLGTSFRTGDSVFDSLAHALPVTLKLTLAAFVLTIVIAIPLGVLAALRRGGIFDHLCRVFSLGGASMPTFWLGYLLIVALAVEWHLFPTQGSDSYVLPSLALSAYSAGVLVRLTRASMLDVLNDDFVFAARARGVPKLHVYRHALRVALNPVVTYLGLVLGGLLGGAVIIETVFSMPGMGKLVVDAINDRDFPIVQGFVLYFGTLVLLVNLAVDLLYVVIDPRVRLLGSSGRIPRAAG